MFRFMSLAFWSGILSRLIEQQQLPSDSGRTASEVNRDVQSAAHIVAQLRARATDAQTEGITQVQSYVNQCEYRAVDVMVGEVLAFKAVVKWIDELTGDRKEAACATDGLGDAAD